MNPFNRRKISIFISMLFLFLLACNATFNVGVPTPTILTPTPTMVPTSVPLISQQVTLVSVPFNETNPGSNFPAYTLAAQTPQLTGSDDPRVLAFNQRLNDLVTKEVDMWRQEFQQLPLTSNSNGSSLNVTYTTSSVMNDLWSFKFDFAFYADSAAHPGLNSMTLNYDLSQGRELTLGDLFLPDSNYLDVISKYCTAELSKQPFFDSPFSDGAKPTPENYRNWTLSPDGVTITFDTYQVAPSAAGPQQVVVPFGVLKSSLNPQGPLAGIVP
ncbi:MAG: RsiV family protein [Chloroflexota bacterium]